MPDPPKTDAEVWAAYLAYAQALKQSYPDAPFTGGIVGRSIRRGVDWFAKFWGKHKATLIPHLTTLAIAAAEALVGQLAGFDSLNPPGPN